MKKTTALFVFLFCTYCFSRAQVPSVELLDSLYHHLEVAQEQGDKALEAQYRRSLANAYSGYDLEKTIELAEEAIPVAKACECHETLIKLYSDLGRAYMNSYEFEKAQEYFQVGIELAANMGSPFDVANLQKDYGVLLYVMGSPDESKEEFEQAIALYEEMDSMHYMLATQGNLAAYYGMEGDFGKAMPLAEESFAYFKDKFDSQMCPQSWYQMGWLYSMQGQIDKGRYYYEGAAKIARNNGHLNQLFTIVKVLADLNVQEGRMDEARMQYLEAYQYASDTVNYPELQRTTSKELANLYASEKDWENAYAWGETYHKLNDSLVEVKAENSFQEQKTIYKTEKKILENRKLAYEGELKSQKIQQKNLAIALLIIGLAVLISLGVIAYILVRNRQRMIRQDLEQKLLLSRVPPHFLFNGLQTLQNLIRKSENELADIQLDSFARLLRYTLESSERSLVSLDRELALLDSYLKIVQVSSDQEFTYSIEVGEEVDVSYWRVPAMVSQIHVENVVKHAFRGLEGRAPELKVKVREEGGNLNLEVVDNGVGRRQAQAEPRAKHQSMGISTLEKQFVLLRKLKKLDITQMIKDRLDQDGNIAGTLVRVVIQD